MNEIQIYMIVQIVLDVVMLGWIVVLHWKTRMHKIMIGILVGAYKVLLEGENDRRKSDKCSAE